MAKRWQKVLGPHHKVEAFLDEEGLHVLEGFRVGSSKRYQWTDAIVPGEFVDDLVLWLQGQRKGR